MSLSLKISNSLESLAGGLARDLVARPNKVFVPNYIVTQTDGMNSWLKMQLASRLGISANHQFLKPNDFIRKLYFLLGGPYTETLSRETLNWLLFRLLSEEEFTRKFPDVADYYSTDKSEVDVRRMALAEKVADLFDQYQIYRPEMIQEWNRSSSSQVPAGNWEQYLWVRARATAGEALPDKSGLATYILEALKDEQRRQDLAGRLPVVHLFGLSILTVYHIRLLYELSDTIHVCFHLLNPTPLVYWMEDASEKQLAIWKRKGKDITSRGVGNALLTSWGRVIRDTLGILFAQDEFLNAYEETSVHTPEPDNLLHKIQWDVFSAAVADRQRITSMDIRDGSLQINSCYTIAREVEILYNYLVHLIDKRKEELSPRDIVVLVSDIDSYAPYIKAVFHNAPYRFPFTIADESYGDGDNLLSALHTVLLLNEEGFTSEAVLQLLDSSFIRERFGIGDLDRIRKAMDAASIRFGVEGSTEDDTHLVSWTSGLRRIMYGICMSGGDRHGEGGDAFYPVDMVEGAEALPLVRFCHFAEVLISFIHQRKADRPISEWVNYIESLVQNLLFEPGEEPDEHYELLIQELSALNLASGYMPEPVAYEVFSRSLLQTLDGSTRSGLFAGGGITFCSLIPMRSIPFRVVAMMGLNYDKFPRRDAPVSFNLIARSPEPGDRNIKENDKHLFLETILSAKDYLYLSYLGQNPQDKAVFPPSALIDELLDYIEAGAEYPQEVRSQLVTCHPLQGFSRKYGAGDQRFYNYLDKGGADVPPRTLPDKPVEELNFKEIRLEDLVRFFRNPFKAYYNKVLGIYYDEDATLLAETELFAVDNLQLWSLKQELLPVAGPADIEERLLKTGQLPLKNMGTVIMRQTEDSVAPVRKLYQQYTAGKEAQSIPLHLSMGDSVVTGTQELVFGRRLLQVCWSKNKTKYGIDAYIRYLAGAAAGLLSGISFLSAAGTPEIMESTSLSAEEAAMRLWELIDIYKEGFRNMAPWYPTFEVKPDKLDNLSLDDFLQMVDKTTINRYKYPCDDPYVLAEYDRGYFANVNVVETFKAIYRRIYLPVPELLPDFFA